MSLLSGPPVNEAINYSSAIASQRSQSADSVDSLSSPMGTSVDSNSNETFDSDEMDLHHVTDSIDVTDSDSSMADAETVSYHSTAHPNLQSEGDSALKLERKSRFKRKVDRLRAKNTALKSTVAQVKSDLALERQRRSTMDKIYVDIKKDLNQKLESEEIKVINLKAEVEQMTAEMKELKDLLASAQISATTVGKTSSLGYKIGYDSSAFSLSGGISNIGGLLLGHHANLDLIDGQDDSEEFLLAHSYSSSTAGGPRTSPINSVSLSAPMNCSDSEEDDDDQDEDMEDDDQSDDDETSGAVSCSFIQTPRSVTPMSSRRGSVSSPSSLPTLAEEDAEGMEEVEEEESDASDNDHDDAPCTMMEIILQRQCSRSSEDDMENAPADANETFETMSQKALFNAIQSKFTVAQAQLQLEELVLKFDARLERTVDVIAKEVSRWWEAERLATGGPISGGWGLEDVVISKEADERISPKIMVEKRVESFFGPLLLQFVASLSEQRTLLDRLGEYARADPRWLKNHNAVLVALYKYDVVEAEAVLEWWQALEEPQGVFGHGGNNLRSLNSRFVAWLEDEEDESESEDDESEDETEEEDEEVSDSDSDFDDDKDDDVMSQDEDGAVEAILDFASPSSNKESKNTDPKPLSPSKAEGGDVSSAETKRRISFCTNNLYYSHDGRMYLKKDPVADGNGEVENGPKKKYVQCPPLRVSDDDSTMSAGDEDEEDESDKEESVAISA
ncbi:hypothetical protein BGZ58_006976 [Dissophora ornata]|nr:hypothetical protein BGZ58_006976 [Dissophora ornata]